MAQPLAVPDADHRPPSRERGTRPAADAESGAEVAQ